MQLLQLNYIANEVPNKNAATSFSLVPPHSHTCETSMNDAGTTQLVNAADTHEKMIQGSSRLPIPSSALTHAVCSSPFLSSAKTCTTLDTLLRMCLLIQTQVEYTRGFQACPARRRYGLEKGIHEHWADCANSSLEVTSLPGTFRPVRVMLQVNQNRYPLPPKNWRRFQSLLPV